MRRPRPWRGSIPCLYRIGVTRASVRLSRGAHGQSTRRPRGRDLPPRLDVLQPGTQRGTVGRLVCGASRHTTGDLARAQRRESGWRSHFGRGQVLGFVGGLASDGRGPEDRLCCAANTRVQPDSNTRLQFCFFRRQQLSRHSERSAARALCDGRRRSAVRCEGAPALRSGNRRPRARHYCGRRPWIQRSRRATAAARPCHRAVDRRCCKGSNAIR